MAMTDAMTPSRARTKRSASAGSCVADLPAKRLYLLPVETKLPVSSNYQQMAQHTAHFRAVRGSPKHKQYRPRRYQPAPAVHRVTGEHQSSPS